MNKSYYVERYKIGKSNWNLARLGVLICIIIGIVCYALTPKINTLFIVFSIFYLIVMIFMLVNFIKGEKNLIEWKKTLDNLPDDV